MKTVYGCTCIIMLMVVNSFSQATNHRFYQAGAPWFDDISRSPLDAKSQEVITWLAAQGGWGTGTMRIDFSIQVMEVDNAAPVRTFQTTGDFYTPDCDHVPVPVPAGGMLEGEVGYACESDGDCHLITLNTQTRMLYEMWRADIRGTVFNGGCCAVWDLKIPYNVPGRGEQCTSADAAGLPIAPLLFTADEVSAGKIEHAIRFILPNSRIRNRTYVRPATHATGAASGGTSAPPYGIRLRLRADYPLQNLPNNGARVVATAMQRFGIILADGGNIALTAQCDTFTTAKWDGLLGPHDLNSLTVNDFEMVEAGQRFAWNGDCERVAVRARPLYLMNRRKSIASFRFQCIDAGESIPLHSNDENDKTVRLYTLQGVLIKSGTVKSSRWPVDDLGHGVYIIDISE